MKRELLVVSILFASAVAPSATGTLAQVADSTTLQAPLADEQAGQAPGAEPQRTEPAAVSGAPAPPVGAVVPAQAERSEAGSVHRTTSRFARLSVVRNTRTGARSESSSLP